MSELNNRSWVFLKEKLIKKSLEVLAIRIASMILFFLVTVFITNNFDSENVGQYDFTRSALILVGCLSVMGMNQSILYYSGVFSSTGNLYQIKEVYVKMIKIILINSILLLCLYSVIPSSYIDYFFEKNVSSLIIKVIATIFFYSITVLNYDALRALEKIRVSEFFRGLYRYGSLFFLVLCICFFQEYQYLADVFLINFVILSLWSSGIILRTFYRGNAPNKTKSFNIPAKEIVKRSFPMSVSMISLLLMQSTDIFLLSKYRGFETVAYYASAVKLTMVIGMALSAVNAIYAPKISELFFNNEKELLRGNIKNATRLVFILTTPGIIILGVFATFILSVFGENYVLADSALRILLIGQMINAFCGSVGIYMNMTGKQIFYQRILLVSFVLNLVLNITLVPNFGMVGAAVATAISLSLWNIVGAIYLLKKEKIKTFLN